MVDKKISELSVATTPLTGTELFVLVQDGETKQLPSTHFLEQTTTAVTSNYTILAEDDIIITDGTLTLQLPAGVNGKRYSIKNINTGTITVLPDASETINGYSNLVVNYRNSGLTLVFAGTNWNIF